MESGHNGELVERDHLVAALGGGEGEEADVGAEIEGTAPVSRRAAPMQNDHSIQRSPVSVGLPPAAASRCESPCAAFPANA
jgi:hypothetical protein